MIEFLVTSSVLIAAVMILRFLFRGKISRRLQYALWIPVLFRLLMPFPLPGSPFSVMNAVPGESISTQAVSVAPAAVSVPAAGSSPVAAENAAAASSAGAMGADGILSLVWLIGAAAAALWIIGTNLAFYRRLRRTRKAFDIPGFKLPVYVSKSTVSPCLFGFPRAAVYLTPKAADHEINTRYVLAHELCHYRHGDHVWSILRGVCLAVYWWNPLVWAAAVLSRADSELACDEAVIRRIGEENRLAYGHTLVDMVAVKAAPSNVLCVATTMASGKRSIRARLNMIIRNPRTFIPALAAVLIIAAVCIAATFTGARNRTGKTGSSTNSPVSAQSKTVSAYARNLYDYRTQYIGSAPPDDALLSAIGIPKTFGSYTMELETKNKPYTLRVVFSEKIADAAALDKTMNKNATLLLALIGNASEIQWQYPGANQTSGKNAGYVGTLTESSAASLLGGNVKNYGKSAEQIQALLNRLDAGVPALDGNRAQSGAAAAGSSPNADSTDLSSCVSSAILSKNAGQFLKGQFATESHTVLKTVKSENTATIYAMILYLEFNYPDGVPTDISGCHMPVAITFKKNASEGYSLKEYWEPKDGSDYNSSIQSKFPTDICENALDTQKYILSQMQDCYAKAIEHGNVDTDAALSKLLKTVCSSPAGQSDLKAYLDAHLVEYQEMTYYGNYALRWCFTRFEKGAQTGLEGSVMASACRDILGKAEAGSPAATGQGWYNAFKKSAIDLQRKNGGDYLKKNRPGSWLLLQMLGDAAD